MRLMARYFLHHFGRLLFPEDREARRELREAVRRALREAAPLPDRATENIVVYCAAVLAAYRLLQRRGVAPEAARERLTQIYSQAAGGRWVAGSTRLALRFMDPQRFVRAFGGERARQGYGATFAFVEEEGPDVYRNRVTRCGFHDYLKRHGAPELTQVFCAWDLLWADEINRSERPVRFYRPQTIAEGADACLFEFRFSSDPEADRSSQPG